VALAGGVSHRFISPNLGINIPYLGSVVTAALPATKGQNNMSDEIKVGDRVSWWEPFKQLQGKEAPRTMTGAVTKITHIRRKGHIAWIKGDGEGWMGETWFRPTSVLTRITDSDLVQAIVAAPQDDQAREDAIAGLRVPTAIQCITTDYEAQKEYGDGGGVEG
jgi:hypothetical protein